MSLFRRLFYRRPPDGLVEISPNILGACTFSLHYSVILLFWLVFDHCFSTDLFEEDELRPYIGGILKQLLGRYSIDSFMVFNFEGDKKDNQIASIFSYYDMSVMGYPRNYEGCPLLTMEMIHHFLRSTLLVYLRRYDDERKALEMVCKQAPDGLAELFSPLDPVPSQLRYLKKVPNFDGQGGCRPIFRLYGPDPLAPNDRSTKILFSNVKTSDFVEHYTQEDCEIIKINVQCPVQGDVVMECTSLDEDYEHEVMMFRAMFSTAFVEYNLLLLDQNQIDILWDTEHRFPADFRVEVIAQAIFSDMDMATTIPTSELSSEDRQSLSKVDDVFSHLDWTSTRDNITKDESGKKELHSEHDGFDVIPLEETEPKFDVAKDDVSSLKLFHEPELPRPNYQHGQLLKDTSTGKELEVDKLENEPDSEMHSSNFRDAEAEDAAGGQWSEIIQMCSCQMEPQAALPLALQSSTTTS
ncbi:hypothetical protein PR202_ga17933 [Eleusine coracana subsp. coracana]|uniref:C2 tensin-type domain-containing protein n=1 Tax=Eleusine coracana subsp. coracana TaxID=191504 RepID=A0AAV5CR84_ELECO|nr:hypothetical protein PR202_ga17933 [Eleusine coracana subsp. coracana]